MSLLSYLTQAAIRDSIQQMTAEVLTRPALLKTDGSSLTYSCDVHISVDDPTGKPWKLGDDPVLDAINQDREAQDPPLPPLDMNRVLRNVPVAQGNRDLVCAEVGQAVTLTRNAGGRLEITGFAKSKPGTRTRIPVQLGTTYGPDDGAGVAPIVGAPENVGMSVHRLTLGELADPQFGDGFGLVPLGAYALFSGDILLTVRA